MRRTIIKYMKRKERNIKSTLKSNEAECLFKMWTFCEREREREKERKIHVTHQTKHTVLLLLWVSLGKLFQIKVLQLLTSCSVGRTFISRNKLENSPSIQSLVRGCKYPKSSIDEHAWWKFISDSYIIALDLHKCRLKL